MAGVNPLSAADVNNVVGGVCRQFVLFQAELARMQTWMAANNLQSAPYSMTSGDEANIKSAISGLNTALQAIDRTFIDRLTGLY